MPLAVAVGNEPVTEIGNVFVLAHLSGITDRHELPFHFGDNPRVAVVPDGCRVVGTARGVAGAARGERPQGLRKALSTVASPATGRVGTADGGERGAGDRPHAVDALRLAAGAE